MAATFLPIANAYAADMRRTAAGDLHEQVLSKRLQINTDGIPQNLLLIMRFFHGHPPVDQISAAAASRQPFGALSLKVLSFHV